MTILDELRHAARSLARSKGFTLTGSLTLALALGLATPIYSMLDGTIHPYTPIKDADQVVVIQPVGPPRSITSYDRFRLIQTGTRFAQQMVPTVSTWQEVTTPTWRGQAHVRTVPGAYFDLLGIRPIMGRNFGNADRDADAIILGVERWRTLFPGRSTLDNATVSLDQRDYAVIGVMPERTGDVFLTMDANRPPPTPDLWVTAFARLKPGVDSAQVARELGIVANQITVEHGERRRPARFEVAPAAPSAERMYGPVATQLTLTGIAVLAITCANLANLMLVRGAARRRDIALRLAIGGSRASVVRGLLAESLLVAAMGAALGTPLALWGVSVLRHVAPIVWSSPYDHFVPYVNWRTIAFLLTAAASVGVVAGVYPGIRASEVRLDEPLKESSGAVTKRATRRHVLLATVELALAMPLIMNTTATARGLLTLRSFEFGFDPSPLLMGNAVFACKDRVRVGGAGDFVHAFSIAEGVPGVVGVAGMSISYFPTPVVPDVPLPPQRVETALVGEATAGFNGLLGVPIIAGRGFEEADLGAPVAIVDRTIANRLWGPSVNPVGHLLKVGQMRSDDPWRRVVGVVGDFENGFFYQGRHHGNVFVQPDTGRQTCGVSVIVRQSGSDPTLATTLARRMDAGLGSYYPSQFQPYLQATGLPRARESNRVWTGTWAVLGGSALGLAAVGLYGVLAFGVGQRRREFAVRKALGSTDREVFRGVLRHGLAIVVAGTALGAGLAISSVYVMRDPRMPALQMQASDLWPFILTEVILCLVAFLACLGPARRAMKADPAEILRAV